MKTKLNEEMKKLLNNKDLREIFQYGYGLIELNINDEFQNDLEFYFMNDIRYMIDNSNYAHSTNYIKLIFLSKKLLPIFVIELDRNKKLDEYIFKSIYNLTQKYKIEELFKHKNYEIVEK